MTKAVALISGGLDSLLAAKVVQEQGIEVLGVAFIMSIAVSDPEKASGSILEAAKAAGIPTRVIDVSDEFLAIVKSPKHGYGSQVNPCIDCKIFMMKRAREIMEEEGASFMITGEVLGERPMSQNRQSLDVIKQESSVDEYLLRPLSAKLLEETIPEKEGMVDRKKLLDIQGRSRKPQLALAKKYGITKFSAPGTSCLLTDPQFADKVKDLLDHDAVTLENITILKTGRHFRLDEKTKVVVGRNEEENTKLHELKAPADVIITMPEELPGPDALLKGEVTDEAVQMAAALVLAHSKFKDAGEMTIEYMDSSNEKKPVTAKPVDKKTTNSLRI